MFGKSYVQKSVTDFGERQHSINHVSWNVQFNCISSLSLSHWEFVSTYSWPMLRYEQFMQILLRCLTRSSAAAERQRVSYTRLSRFAHWSCTSLNTASVIQLYNRVDYLNSYRHYQAQRTNRVTWSPLKCDRYIISTGGMYSAYLIYLLWHCVQSLLKTNVKLF